MKKHEIEIVRPNGKTEIIDVTSKFPQLTNYIVSEIREQTAKAGRGNVVRGFINGVELEPDVKTTGKDGYKSVYSHSFTAEVSKAGDINKFNTK
jgi:hypothetical protein